jgi:HD-GYP domain-containing protein (c-di-GMP phosphodiesterase class II)
MTDHRNREYQTLILAALLHDVDKLARSKEL